jgi:1-acyl-sn-glycerol-3-phosphate acyltransferase
VVCPDAEVKFYLTASLEARARRRQAELAAAGTHVPLAAITAELSARDTQDETRELAPLRKAPGAIEVDTSDLTAEQVVEWLLAAIERRGSGAEQRRAAPAQREDAPERREDAPERREDVPGRREDASRPSTFYAVLKLLALAVMRVFFRLESRGRDNIPATGPVLLVANHSSVLDPPLVGGSAPRQLSFLAKAELFRVPLFGGLIRRLNARPIRREGADPAALRTAMRVLEEGGALLIFPEGTRGDEGVIRDAKAGAGMLAVLSGAAVVPVYVRGSGRAWPRGQRLPRPTKVTVTFGEARTFAAAGGADRKRQYEVASREMMEAIMRLRDAAAAEPGKRWSEPYAARSK